MNKIIYLCWSEEYILQNSLTSQIKISLRFLPKRRAILTARKECNICNNLGHSWTVSCVLNIALPVFVSFCRLKWELWKREPLNSKQNCKYSGYVEANNYIRFVFLQDWQTNTFTNNSELVKATIFSFVKGSASLKTPNKVHFTFCSVKTIIMGIYLKSC